MNRRRVVVVGGAAIAALAAISFGGNPHIIVWNRTPSAPLGLYYVKQTPPKKDGWALLSADAPAAQWTADRGYLAPGWPIIKRVAGVAGDEICRNDARVFVNGAHVATALKKDSHDTELPVWSGCMILQAGEFFLLNDHPRSLDGRYFGAMKASEIDGDAVLLWERRR